MVCKDCRDLLVLQERRDLLALPEPMVNLEHRAAEDRLALTDPWVLPVLSVLLVLADLKERKESVDLLESLVPLDLLDPLENQQVMTQQLYLHCLARAAPPRAPTHSVQTNRSECSVTACPTRRRRTWLSEPTRT